jgi:hypothetical protein
MYHTSTYNSARLPSIANFDMAKRIFEEVKPIRGRYPEQKPLGKNRRYTWMQIHKRHSSKESEANPLGEFVTSYACQLYSTDCIEFFPDGEVVLRVNQWKGPTTMMFLNYVLEEYIGRVGSEGSKWYFINKLGEAFPMPTAHNTGMSLKFVDGFGFRPTEIKQEHKYQVRRKEMNKLRKYYDDFIEYGKSMLMADGHLGSWENLRGLRDAFGFKIDDFKGYHEYSRYDGDKPILISIAEQRNRLMRLVQDAMEKNDLEMKYKLMYVVASGASYYSYRDSSYSSSADRFAKAFDEIIKYHHEDVVFERIPQDIGVPFRDRNAKYVKGAE